MADQTQYSINMDVRYAPLELVEIPTMFAACEEDELFYVVDGTLQIDLEGRSIELRPKQGFTIPRGVQHRTRAPGGAVILMVEGRGVVPTGD